MRRNPIPVSAVCFCVCTLLFNSDLYAQPMPVQRGASQADSTGDQEPDAKYVARASDTGGGESEITLWQTNTDTGEDRLLARLGKNRMSAPEVVQVLVEGTQAGVLIRYDTSRHHASQDDGHHYMYFYHLLSSDPQGLLAELGYQAMPRLVKRSEPYAWLGGEYLSWLRNETRGREKWAGKAVLESSRKIVTENTKDQKPQENHGEFRVDSFVLDGSETTRQGMFPGMRSDFLVYYLPEDARRLVRMVVDGELVAKEGDLYGYSSIVHWSERAFDDWKAMEDFFRPYAGSEKQLEAFMAKMRGFKEKNQENQAKLRAEGVRLYEEEMRREAEFMEERAQSQEAYLLQVMQEKEDSKRARELRRLQQEAEDAE